ncbi:MAG: hypothetical protein ACNA7Z_01185 [Dethiobacteria bacterium]|nr:hypothetical protein [Bacillota bacterium]MDW7730752.1 hypothetical protein [Bacillota bacterium]
MNKVKHSILIVIFIVLVLNGFLFQTGFSAGRTVLNSAYYRTMINETELASFIHAVVQEHIFREVSTELPDNLALIITGSITMVFDQEWLEEQVVLVTDDYIDYIKGRKDTPRAVLDLRQKKEELRKGIENALDLIPGQVISLVGFDSLDLEELAAELVAGLPLPDEVEVQQLLEQQNVSDEFLLLLQNLRQYRTFYTYLPFLLYFIFFYIVYRIAGLPGALKWFGGAALISGVIFSIFLQGIRTYYLKLLVEELAFSGLPEPEMLLASLRYVIDDIAAISLYFALAGVSAMLLGGLGAWLGLFRRKKTA